MVRRGRRFESARGLCKSAARRRFYVQVDLQVQPRAVGIEPIMELSRWRGPLSRRVNAGDEVWMCDRDGP
jgi:hypothetical protein